MRKWFQENPSLSLGPKVGMRGKESSTDFALLGARTWVFISSTAQSLVMGGTTGRRYGEGMRELQGLHGERALTAQGGLQKQTLQR